MRTERYELGEFGDVCKTAIAPVALCQPGSLW